MKTMKTLDHAKKLIASGISVFPLRKGEKIPAISWKEFQSRHATEAELVKWFGNDDHDIAIVTGKISGITVIDTDSQSAFDEAFSVGLISPVCQPTPRGNHFVFAYNGERNSTNIYGVKGLDIRADGGYVKAYPGSVYWNLSLLRTIDANNLKQFNGRHNAPTCQCTQKSDVEKTSGNRPESVGYIVETSKGEDCFSVCYYDENDLPDNYPRPKYGCGEFSEIDGAVVFVACVEACT